MIYGITKEELDPSLLEYLKNIASNQNDGSLKYLKSSTTLLADSKVANIGITGYTKERDLLLVYKNSVYIEEGIDFSISSNSVKIMSLNDTWSTGTMFNFVCLTNVPESPKLDISGASIVPKTISLDKLDDELQAILNSNSSKDSIDGGLF